MGPHFQSFFFFVTFLDRETEEKIQVSEKKMKPNETAYNRCMMKMKDSPRDMKG